MIDGEMINSNNIPPYLKKNMSILVTLSAAIALVLLASPVLPLSNLLVQPAQASSIGSSSSVPMTFKTPSPVFNPENTATLTFEAHGTNSSDNPPMTGSYKVKNTQDGSTLYSGNIENGQFTNNSRGASISLSNAGDPSDLSISAACSTADGNLIDFVLNGEGIELIFTGAVECSSQGGGNTASSMTGSTQDGDGDGDGIPDSSDRCANNSNSRCYIDAR
jgi:hypothetical protein